MTSLLRLAIVAMGFACSRLSCAEEVTIASRMEQVGETVRSRIEPLFARQRIPYPPEKLALVAVKDEKRLKIFAIDKTGDWQFVYQYQIAKLSGKLGPKLKSGDKQVPEGLYKVTHLNPASKFWLSLALNYPNSFDRAQARKDKRTSLGGDIMLHGWWFSEGCVAVGNTASEDLFVMAKEIGLDNLSVLITPTDFRKDKLPAELPSKPQWTKELYADIRDELNKFGSDGITTDSRLIAYADIAPPPPPEPKTLLGKVLRALANAAETSGTEKQEED